MAYNDNEYMASSTFLKHHLPSWGITPTRLTRMANEVCAKHSIEIRNELSNVGSKDNPVFRKTFPGMVLEIALAKIMQTFYYTYEDPILEAEQDEYLYFFTTKYAK
jgi:hypothetical protein